MRMAGDRWKERLLAGELKDKEEEYISVALKQVGRVFVSKLQPGGQGHSDDHRTQQLAGSESAAGLRGRGAAHGGALTFEPLSVLISCRLCVELDCRNIVQWANGTWKMFNARYVEPLVRTLDTIEQLYDSACRPMTQAADWFQHISRTENSSADHLARQAEDLCTLHKPFPWPPMLHARCDGGASRRAGAGCGWSLWGCATAEGSTCESSWVHLASSSWILPPYSLPLEAEFAGLLSLLRFVRQVILEGGLRGEKSGDASRDQLWQRLAWRIPYVRADGREEAATSTLR